MRDDDILCCQTDFWVFMVISLVLVAFAGIASGLALGLLSFSQVDLEVLIKSGQPQEQKNAAKILPLVKNEHLLLCTLLIGKSLAMEALPIFLDSILPVWAAILVSGTLVLAFAEIIPQAVCSRYGLSLGAKMSHLVRLLLVVFLPLSYPCSKLLDCLLGKGHSALLKRGELKTLVDLHANEAGKGGELSHHETTIIAGALDLTSKTAKDAMTPISQTFSLDINSKLNIHTLGLITSKGHSRIPIYSGTPTNIIGIILLKNLIFSRPEDETPIKYLTIRRIPRVYDNSPLYDVLQQFQKGHSHMVAVVKSNKDTNSRSLSTLAEGRGNLNYTENKVFGQKFVFRLVEFMVVKCDSTGLNFSHEQKERLSISVDIPSPLYSTETANTKHRQGLRTQNVSSESLESLQGDEEVIGIITMEDVMEELLQEDIRDETDEYVDVHNKIKINLLPYSRRSSASNTLSKSASQIYWRTPEPALLSSYSTSAPGSPIHPYTQQPIIRPALHASAGLVSS
ncbi:DUF21 domain-containing protein At5g52790-like [Malus sylvestris]|uniref:DUF21 domain-containing protein At5g52790-like n=1 Tax=Malus sylvestris TaxID=3752 RepID=UPI0021ACD6A9|nr:DUF21 domain-containing protein At5g52790-like [Malus sylvestris]